MRFFPTFLSCFTLISIAHASPAQRPCLETLMAQGTARLETPTQLSLFVADASTITWRRSTAPFVTTTDLASAELSMMDPIAFSHAESNVALLSDTRGGLFELSPETQGAVAISGLVLDAAFSTTSRRWRVLVQLSNGFQLFERIAANQWQTTGPLITDTGCNSLFVSSRDVTTVRCNGAVGRHFLRIDKEAVIPLGTFTPPTLSRTGWFRDHGMGETSSGELLVWGDAGHNVFAEDLDTNPTALTSLGSALDSLHRYVLGDDGVWRDERVPVPALTLAYYTVLAARAETIALGNWNSGGSPTTVMILRAGNAWQPEVITTEAPGYVIDHVAIAGATVMYDTAITATVFEAAGRTEHTIGAASVGRPCPRGCQSHDSPWSWLLLAIVSRSAFRRRCRKEATAEPGQINSRAKPAR